MISKKKFLVIDILVVLFIAAIPLIIFAAIPYWPSNNPTAIIFYITYALAPILHFLTLFLVLRRGWMQSDNIAINQIKTTFFLPILPIFTFIMYLIPMDSKWQLIVTLIIDVAFLIAYIVITLMFAQIGDKASKDLTTHQSEFIAPKEESSYDNDDGSFKGSSWRK